MKNLIQLAVLLVFSLNIFSQTVTLDSCSFESSCPILIIDTSSTNLWEIGTPSKTTLDSAYSTTNALITDSLNTYSINNHSWFTLTPTDNNGDITTDNMRLEFNYKIDSDSLLDGGYIEVSYDYGQTWYNVIHEFSNNPFNIIFFGTNLYHSNDTLFNGEIGVSGTSSEWKRAYLNWIWSAPIKSYTIDTLMIRFNFISDSINTNKDGWMIDDIKVSYDNLSSINSLINNKLNVYPSPTKDLLNIDVDKLNDFEITSIQLTNNLGQVILNKSLSQDKTQLSIGNLPKGVYHIILKQGNDVIGRSKVVKE